MRFKRCLSCNKILIGNYDVFTGNIKKGNFCNIKCKKNYANFKKENKEWEKLIKMDIIAKREAKESGALTKRGIY